MGPPQAAPHEIERPEDNLERHLSGELQVRELRLLRKLGGRQPPGVQHLPGKLGRLRFSLELEGLRERHRHGAVGRGPFHAEVHGLAWRGQGGGLRHHDRLDVQGLQAKGREGERKVAAELCTNLNSGHAPIHEAFRLFRVPEGYTAVRRCAEGACRSFRYGTQGHYSPTVSQSESTLLHSAVLGWTSGSQFSPRFIHAILKKK